MRLIKNTWEWLDSRMQVGAAVRETVEHPVPKETASWFYVFGSAATVVFGMQIVTGILLALSPLRPSSRRLYLHLLLPHALLPLPRLPPNPFCPPPSHLPLHPPPPL